MICFVLIGTYNLNSSIDQYFSFFGLPVVSIVSRLGSITARHFSSGRQPNCGVEQRAPPIFGRVAITLGIGPHF